MKLLIATPSLNRTPCCEYQQSMIRTMSQLASMQIEAHLFFLGGDAFIDHARDHIVNLFMQTDCTDLLMIDDDQGWDVSSVIQLLESDKPIVGGVVIGREGTGKWHVAIDTDESGQFNIENGLIDVKHVGAAFLRIKREAIEKMIAAYPDLYYMTDGNKVAALFKTVIEDHQYIGEDTAFCRRWTALGEKLYVMPDMNFQHIGRNRWEGNFFHHLMASQPEGQQPVSVIEISNQAEAAVH